MQIIDREVDGKDRLFFVKFDDSRVAYLRVDTKSHPLQIKAGDVTGVLGSDEHHSSLDEAGTWLLDEIKQKRIAL